MHSVDKIGDPQPIDPPNVEGNVNSPAVNENAVAASSMAVQVPPQVVPQVAAVSPHVSRSGSSKSGRGTIFPIEGLSPYQNNWTIKARVTQKSDIKTWSNSRGEGKLFNVTLMDDSGEIRATGFNAVVDDLYPLFEEGKVYYLSKARVNLAKKKFSNVNNDYELGLEKNTEIEEVSVWFFPNAFSDMQCQCHEVTNLPTIKYNFISLDHLEDLIKDAVCGAYWPWVMLLF